MTCAADPRYHQSLFSASRVTVGDVSSPQIALAVLVTNEVCLILPTCMCEFTSPGRRAQPTDLDDTVIAHIISLEDNGASTFRATLHASCGGTGYNTTLLDLLQSNNYHRHGQARARARPHRVTRQGWDCR